MLKYSKIVFFKLKKFVKENIDSSIIFYFSKNEKNYLFILHICVEVAKVLRVFR
jgi:hypothetical protein